MTDLQARVLALRVHAMHRIEACRRREAEVQKQQRERAYTSNDVARSLLGIRVERETWEEAISFLGAPSND